MNRPSSEFSSSSRPVGDQSRESPDSALSFPIVVLGGGEAGSALLRALNDAALAGIGGLIEPSAHHFDQPEWMRVGTEGVEKEQTRSPKDEQVPGQVTWIQDRATNIDPNAQTIVTEEGRTIRYGHLVVALGTETRWDRIRDLERNLGTHGICSVYGYEQAEQAWKMIWAFEGGRAIFTAPSTPHKGGSAPLHILQRAASVWQETGVRARTEIIFAVASPTGLDDETYDEPVEAETGDIHVYRGYDLVDVRPASHEAVFNVAKGRSRSRDVLPYDLLHVVPPMRPPALLAQSELAYRDGVMKGYMDVHPDTFRHQRFDTVFGIGDAIGIEGVKTGERARKQARTVARTLRELYAE